MLGMPLKPLSRVPEERENLNPLSLLSLNKGDSLSSYTRPGARIGWKSALLVMGTEVYSPGATEWAGLSAPQPGVSSHPF